MRLAKLRLPREGRWDTSVVCIVLFCVKLLCVLCCLVVFCLFLIVVVLVIREAFLIIYKLYNIDRLFT